MLPPWLEPNRQEIEAALPPLAILVRHPDASEAMLEDLPGRARSRSSGCFAPSG